MKLIKNKKNLLKVLEPLIITVFWLLLFASPLLLRQNEYNINWANIFNVWKSFIPYLVVFLFNRLILLPYLFFRNKQLLFFISNILLILMMAAGIHFFKPGVAPPRDRMIPGETVVPRNESIPPPRESNPPHRESLPPHPDARGEGPRPKPPPRQLPPYISFVIISVLVVGFDTGLMISVKWAQSEQKRVQAEKENVETQLAFLRNQVSPHFFMNTLNNIHALIDHDTREAKESIIKLSKLMRHLLYDSQVDTIPLKKEIEFIKNYVELMKLRYSEKVKIDLSLPAQLPDKSIPPLLFTSFMENAFRHGISYQGSSFINITFSYLPESLTFVVKNSNPRIKKDRESFGIGIDNARKRLDIIYGDRYTLNIEDRKDEFIVILTVPV